MCKCQQSASRNWKIDSGKTQDLHTGGELTNPAFSACLPSNDWSYRAEMSEKQLQTTKIARHIGKNKLLKESKTQLALLKHITGFEGVFKKKKIKKK